MKLVGYDSCASWFVALGCGIIYGFSLTPYRLAGLLFVIIIERYDTDREKASIPIVLFMMVRCLSGPFIGILGEKFGVEKITLFGCVLTCVGVGGCYFAEDILGVTFFLGLIYGIGMSFGNAVLANIIKKHFIKHLSSANGISSAGSCVGAIIVPPAAIFLMDRYGVSGSFLMFSGIMLNAVPVAQLIQKASSFQDKIQIKQRNGNFQKRLPLVPKNEPPVNTEVHTAERSELEKGEVVTGKIAEIQNQVPIFISKTFLNEKQECISKSSLKVTVPLSAISDSRCREQAGKGLSCESSYVEKSCSQELNQAQNLDVEIGNEMQRSTEVNNPNDLENYSISKNLRIKKNKNFYHSLSIFKEFSYLLILFIHGLQAYVIALFWTTMIDFSRDKNISKENEIYFLMLHPLIDLIGRLGLGWITDLGYLSIEKFVTLFFGLMGLSCGWVLWSNDFSMMMTGALIFAFVSGGIMSALPSVIYSCVQKDKQTMAMASKGLLYGFLSFSSSPLIGYFRETLGSYNGLYYLFIVMCFLSSASTPLIFRFSSEYQKKLSNRLKM